MDEATKKAQTRARQLCELAANEGTTDGERAAAALAAVKLIRKHRLLGGEGRVVSGEVHGAPPPRARPPAQGFVTGCMGMMCSDQTCGICELYRVFERKAAAERERAANSQHAPEPPKRAPGCGTVSRPHRYFEGVCRQCHARQPEAQRRAEAPPCERLGHTFSSRGRCVYCQRSYESVENEAQAKARADCKTVGHDFGFFSASCTRCGAENPRASWDVNPGTYSNRASDATWAASADYFRKVQDAVADAWRTGDKPGPGMRSWDPVDFRSVMNDPAVAERMKNAGNVSPADCVAKGAHPQLHKCAFCTYRSGGGPVDFKTGGVREYDGTVTFHRCAVCGWMGDPPAGGQCPLCT